MNITKENIIIKNIGKKSILADVSFSGNSKSKPIVLFCHGYKGFKDWGAWNLVAKQFAEDGFVFIKFNFSHNGGTINNPIDFIDEDAFGKNTYSLELEDSNRMINWISLNYPNQEINIIGHSRGGGIATLAAAQNDKISKLCSWASVCDYKYRFVTGKQLEQWKAKGVMYVKNGRTKQDLPHYYTFYEDFIANEEALNIKFWTNKIEKPHLIVHGTNDEAVAINEANSLHSWNSKSILFELDTNHTFGTKHPWDLDTMSIDLKRIVARTILFFR